MEIYRKRERGVVSLLLLRQMECRLWEVEEEVEVMFVLHDIAREVFGTVMWYRTVLKVSSSTAWVGTLSLSLRLIHAHISKWKQKASQHSQPQLLCIKWNATDENLRSRNNHISAIYSNATTRKLLNWIATTDMIKYLISQQHDTQQLVHLVDHLLQNTFCCQFLRFSIWSLP